MKLNDFAIVSMWVNQFTNVEKKKRIESREIFVYIQKPVSKTGFCAKKDWKKTRTWQDWWYLDQQKTRRFGRINKPTWLILKIFKEL